MHLYEFCKFWQKAKKCLHWKNTNILTASNRFREVLDQNEKDFDFELINF